MSWQRIHTGILQAVRKVNNEGFVTFNTCYAQTKKKLKTKYNRFLQIKILLRH